MFPEELVELGPNIFFPDTGRGTYFYINDNVAIGAIYCSGTRNVITCGLGPEHADASKAEARVANSVQKRYKNVKKILAGIPEADAFYNYIDRGFHADKMMYVIQQDPDRDWHVTLPPPR